MHSSRILTGAVLAALLLAPAAADAKKRGSAPKGPFLTVSGDVTRTSVIRSRCPIPSALRATSIETTTTTHSYTFSGASAKGRDPGGMRSDGETTYLFVREVEGESEYVKPETLGPTTRRVGGQQGGGFGEAVRATRDSAGAAAVSVDLGPLAGGLRHTLLVPLPKKGRPKSYPLRVPDTTRRDPRPAPGCTHSETITVRGNVTVGRRP